LTLVVAAQNNDYAVQVSDRRLTGPDGSLIDDESNKLVILESDAFRFLVGFSGLAGDGKRFKMNVWLAETLPDAAPPDYIPAGFIERLRNALTRKFASEPLRGLPASARRTSIMLNGFVYTTIGPLVAYCMLTNFQDYVRGSDDAEPWPEFRAWCRVLQNPVRPAWSVQRIGAWPQFGPAQWEAVKRLLTTHRPPQAVVGKTVELIREIAGPKDGGSAIGRQLMSAVLPVSGAGTFAYHSDEISMALQSPAVVFAKKALGGAIFSDLRLEETGPAPKPVVFPRQRPNQLCACGSGKKYKKCHGRFQ